MGDGLGSKPTTGARAPFHPIHPAAFFSGTVRIHPSSLTGERNGKQVGRETILPYRLPVKTTIDIPDFLYKKAKIRAVERGLTLKDIVLSSLERELDAPLSGAAPPVARWGQRKFLPEFARLEAAGAFTARPGDRDITVLISDDREGR